ncbi:TetR/AcrR family transcriptional regulator [Actinokineospora alba]|uniref:TetR/AcrR family transcriptional regulator n=1 Tax=Actinokineospora alba TaxID=504798 RepID=UPI001414F152|nr:TetR/AcrR family transcriptional regulator [Actinokineospora alba]
MTERQRAPRMTPDDRRKAIVKAVVPLLIEHGQAVTTKQIAEAAGIAEGTIFRAFPDKCALMVAAAEETMNPQDRAQTFAAALEGAGDLRDKVERITAHLLERFRMTMAVMIAVRGFLMSGDRPADGPPKFIVEANRSLHTALTELFAAHRDELSVPPETAAIALRSLVFGSRHPGMDFDEITPDEIARVLLHGVTKEGEH